MRNRISDMFEDADEYLIGVKVGITLIPMGAAAIRAFFKWWPSQKGTVLYNGRWSWFFMLVYLFFLWMSIVGNLPRRTEDCLSRGVLRFVPALDTTTARKWLLVTLFVTPALCILGWFAARYALSSMNPEVYESPLTDEIAYSIPLLGTILEDTEAFSSILFPKYPEDAWSAILSLSCSVGVLLLCMLLISIPAKLMAGQSTSRSILVRLLVGSAMFVYSVILSIQVSELVQTELYSPARMEEVVIRIDHSGGAVMLLCYLLLAIVGAIFCANMVLIMSGMCDFILVLFVLAIIIPRFMYYLKVGLPHFLRICVAVAFFVQFWSMVPKDE